MNAPTAVLAEDEAVLRGELRARLADLWPELHIAAEAADGVEATRAFAAHAPDVLILDIQMPSMTGLEVARIASGKCHVVFVTAYDKYAIAAFEQGAVDYLMKPINPARMATAVQRLKERLATPPANLTDLLGALANQQSEARRFLRWINASIGNTIKVITVDEICYFKADARYTLVVTPASESLIKKPIRELTEELDPTMFWQIHRSTLVNVHSIAAVTRDLRGHLQLKLKQRQEALPVSESYAHLFRQM